MFRQQANRIYNRVEGRDPTNSDNPPFTPYLFLNWVTGELFSCLSNEIDNNYWRGSLGTTIYPYALPINEVKETISLSFSPRGMTITDDGDLIATAADRLVRRYNGFDTSSVASSFTTANLSVSCLAWYNGDVYVGDYNSVNEIDKHVGFSSSVASSFNTTFGTLRAITFVGEKFYYGDMNTKTVKAHASFGSSPVIDSWTVADGVSGLAYDGRYLAVVMYTGRVLMTDLETHAVVSDFTVPSIQVWGAAFYNGRLYLADNVNNRVVVLKHERDNDF